MDVEEILKKGRSYPENFFYGDVSKIGKIYELPEGLFLLVRTSTENELLWGTNTIDDLKRGLETVEKDGTDFIFRYAGNFNDVMEKKDIISRWGYRVKCVHVGYYLYMENRRFQTKNMHFIEELKEKDIEEFLDLERTIFDSFNVTKNELTKWINSDESIVLVNKINGKLKGFIVINIYGAGKKSCLIRNIGVAESERRKGIGKELLLKGLQRAKEKGVKTAMLWVEIENTAARRLYERTGFILDQNEAEAVFLGRQISSF